MVCRDTKSIQVSIAVHNNHKSILTEALMREILITAIITFMFTDTFFMLCLLRASALYEQKEQEAMEHQNTSD